MANNTQNKPAKFLSICILLIIGKLLPILEAIELLKNVFSTMFLVIDKYLWTFSPTKQFNSPQDYWTHQDKF